jgi:hypothetical protein
VERQRSRAKESATCVHRKEGVQEAQPVSAWTDGGRYAWRTAQLTPRGCYVLCLCNDEVQHNLDGVTEAIWPAPQTPLPYPPPCQTTGEGPELTQLPRWTVSFATETI